MKRLLKKICRGAKKNNNRITNTGNYQLSVYVSPNKLKMSTSSQIQTKQEKQFSSMQKKELIKKSRKERRNEKEIEILQARTTTVLPKSTFKRVIVQEAKKHSSSTLRFNVEAVHALQAAAEQELTTIFSGAAFIAGIAKRETITCEDMNNFQTIRKLY
jgi:histone H3/H4